MSPTLTPWSFAGSFTLIVRVFPAGPLKVTVGTLGSIAVILTVNVVCCAQLPAGISPGRAPLVVVVVSTPAEPPFFTS